MTELEALQTTLAAEHAAVYVYGLLGSRTSQAGEASCTTRCGRPTRRTASGGTR